LLQLTADTAPQVCWGVVPRPRDLTSALESGDVDLAIVPVLLGDGSFGQDPAPELRQRTLFRDRFRVFIHQNHLPGGRMTLRRYRELGHILVSPTGRGPGVIDQALGDHGDQRRVALRVPHFSTALRIVEQSALALTAPSALSLCAAPYVAATDLPFPFPDHALAMVWHARYSDDPAHVWMRESFLEACEELGHRASARRGPRGRSKQRT
jgi:DNA-binding transcriptional LysR family regulator